MGSKEGSHKKYVLLSTYSCPGAPQILFTRDFTADSYLHLHFKDEKVRPRKVLCNLPKVTYQGKGKVGIQTYVFVTSKSRLILVS